MAEPARPKTTVAVRIDDAAAKAPSAGTEMGTSVMSPRLVNEETRPIWLGCDGTQESSGQPDRRQPGRHANGRHRNDHHRQPTSPDEGHGNAFDNEDPEASHCRVLRSAI